MNMYKTILENAMHGVLPTVWKDDDGRLMKGMDVLYVRQALESVKDNDFWNEILKIERG